MTSSSPALPPVLLVASRIRTEERHILDSLRRHGIEAERLDPRTMVSAAHLDQRSRGLALIREISSTRARYAALALAHAGAVTINSAEAIGVCADKWLTSMAFARDAIPTPRTAIALTPQAALAECERVGYPVVLKPLSSSWGRRVALVRDPDAAQAVLEHCAALPAPQAHIIYLQEYIKKPGRDIRVIVVNDRPVGAIYRVASDWRTNVALGAETRPCPLTPELAKLATEAARAVGAEVAGVDVVEDQSGRLLALEVNQGVEFAGFERALGERANVADAIAELVRERRELVVAGMP